MFFSTRYIPVRCTQVPPYVSVEHCFALWTYDQCGGPILGLGFRKKATAPFYISFSLWLSEIFNCIDCCGFVLGAHLLLAVLPIMVCLSSLPRYLLHVYYFCNSCFPFDDKRSVFPLFRVFLFTLTRPCLVLRACVPCMPLFFFVTEAGLLFLQTCFLPEYLIVSHSAAFCNHYAFADLWPWIGLGFVFSADEEMGCVHGLVGCCRHRRRRKQRLPRNPPRVVVVVANRRKRFVLLPGLLWRRCIF